MASRDFLSGFGREARTPSSEDKAGGSEEIDKLRLGLSLGGCFGTGPTMPEAKKQCLPRSSSTAAVCTLPREDLATTAEPLPPLLHRTSSLPTEHDEARFQRKAMQCQRRLAAKRKRLERRNSMNSGRSDAQEPSQGFPLRRASSNMPEQGGSGGAEYTKSSSAMNTSSDNSSGQNSSGPSLLAPTTPSSGGACRRPPPPRSLRSLTTMRTASTGDFRKTRTMTEEEMPMVFSRLECPNARRVDGFLYKLGKAANDDVRIVCVCHGNFLTPAEFVRHAGGGVDDLAHPLRHIVINKQPSEFL